MDSRLTVLLISAIFLATIVTFFISVGRGVPFLSVAPNCFKWAAVIVGLMLFNYWLADVLQLSHHFSGYARGKKVISPYAFFVKVLLFFEIGALIFLKRQLKEKREEEPQKNNSTKQKTQSHTNLHATHTTQPKGNPLQTKRTFSPGLLSLFFILCSGGNFWFALKILKSSSYGFFLLAIAVGLLIASYRAAFRYVLRRET